MILNRQRQVRVSVRELELFLARALRLVRVPTGAIGVCLVTNAKIAKWNRAYRGKNSPTDVLSFPAAHGAKRTKLNSKSPVKRSIGSTRGAGAFYDSSPSYLGDIAIAPAVARKNARRFGRTLGHELRILVLHGILHLMGYDHETDTGQMDRRETRLRRALDLA
jgi:probable rRNA maturation factor